MTTQAPNIPSLFPFCVNKEVQQPFLSPLLLYLTFPLCFSYLLTLLCGYALLITRSAPGFRGRNARVFTVTRM